MGVIVRSVIAVCLALSGCVPMRVTDVSAVSGTVLDSRTKKPISDADVHCGEHPEQQAKTDALGAFAVPPHKTWALVLLGGDYLSSNCTLIVEAAGYSQSTKRVPFGDDKAQSIRLEPALK